VAGLRRATVIVQPTTATRSGPTALSGSGRFVLIRTLPSSQRRRLCAAVDGSAGESAHRRQFRALAAMPAAFILVSVLGRIALALIIMAMQAESLEVLEKADVPSAQARAIVRAIEIELAGAKDTLATKHDLLLLRQELRQEMVELRGELRQEMAELRGELRQEIAELGGQLRREMAEQGGSLRAEMHGMASSITRQMYMALLAQMAVLLGIAYFFVTHVNV
jgi:hypothetical protein